MRGFDDLLFFLLFPGMIGFACFLRFSFVVYGMLAVSCMLKVSPNAQCNGVNGKLFDLNKLVIDGTPLCVCTRRFQRVSTSDAPASKEIVCISF